MLITIKTTVAKNTLINIIGILIPDKFSLIKNDNSEQHIKFCGTDSILQSGNYGLIDLYSYKYIQSFIYLLELRNYPTETQIYFKNDDDTYKHILFITNLINITNNMYITKFSIVNHYLYNSYFFNCIKNANINKY